MPLRPQMSMCMFDNEEEKKWIGMGWTNSTSNSTPEYRVLKVELNGFRKEDIKLEVQVGRMLVLTISLQHSVELINSSRILPVKINRYVRSYCMPEDADLDATNAFFGDGVLEIVVPTVSGSATVREMEISG